MRSNLNPEAHAHLLELEEELAPHVALRLLDLDNLRPEIRHGARARGCRDDRGQFDHADA